MQACIAAAGGTGNRQSAARRKSPNESCRTILTFDSLATRGEVSQRSEHSDVEHDADPDPSEKRARLAPGGLLVQEGDQQEKQPADTKPQDPQDFPVEWANLGRNVLQRLKHEDEVPFGADARGRGRKGVSLLPELPWVDRSQRSQDAQGGQPAEKVPQQEIWNEWH